LSATPPISPECTPREYVPTAPSWHIAQAALRLSAAKKVRIYTGGNNKVEHLPREHAGIEPPLNAWGRHMRHLAMHSGVVPMARDPWGGRCAYCVKRGWWKPDDIR